MAKSYLKGRSLTLEIQDKVLLFGQSAGAANAFIISTLPEAPSLIKAVASESGGGRDLPFKSTAEKIGLQFASTLGCSTDDVCCFKASLQ